MKNDFKEKYKVPNNKEKKKISKPKKLGKMTLRGKITVTLMAVAAGVGAYGLYTTTQQDNQPININQALENGETLEELGIDNNIKNELDKIGNILQNNDEIDNSTLITLAPEINNLQFDILKTKLANTLGVDEKDITIYTSKGDEGSTNEYVEIKNGETYRNKKFLNFDHTIPEDISEYIKEVAYTQSLMRQMQKGDFKREDVLEKYQELFKSASEMAAAKMTVDKNHNISVEKMTVKDLASTKVNNERKETENYKMTIQQIGDEER